jgi:hypothetical protein
MTSNVFCRSYIQCGSHLHNTHFSSITTICTDHPPFRTFQEAYDGYFWLSCLRFADKWNFEKQKSLALSRINVISETPKGSAQPVPDLASSVSPAVKISAARLCDKGLDWLVPAFKDMMLNHPPTYKDGLVLSLTDMVLFCQIQFHRTKFRDIDDYLRAVLAGGVSPEDVEGYSAWKQRQS